jgi:hypothetical protein
MATTPAVSHSKPRAIVYIDGFTLYYGAVRDVPALKWLNIEKLCRQLRPNDDLQNIEYFTAIKAGPTKPHQEIDFRALATPSAVAETSTRPSKVVWREF